MGQVVLLSFTAAFNPTLLTATTVMLLLPRPGRLMFGYWLGAMLTSVTLGLVIVLALGGSNSTTSTTQSSVSPAIDIALGALALVAAVALFTERDKSLSERRAKKKKKKEDKGPPRWQRTLSKGTPRTTFLIGMVLTLPGASYLAGLHRISKLGYSTTTEVLLVVGFNLVMLILLELPMVAFAVAPERTATSIERVKAWLRVHGRRYAGGGLAFVGVALTIKGLVGLLS
jgi:hypothetical protein